MLQRIKYVIDQVTGPENPHAAILDFEISNHLAHRHSCAALSQSHTFTPNTQHLRTFDFEKRRRRRRHRGSSRVSPRGHPPSRPRTVISRRPCRRQNGAALGRRLRIEKGNHATASLLRRNAGDAPLILSQLQRSLRPQILTPITCR
jgi:uncharacterized protein involved in type VI secretion and phage assembly